MRPLVSIAIPTLNRCHYLKSALASAQNQTYPQLQIIVSDNCSADETQDWLSSVEDSRVSILRQPVTVPVFEHWDKCLNAATGEYFLVLSDDDLLEPDAIERMVDLFEAARCRGDELAFVSCRVTVIDGMGAAKYLGAPVPESDPAEHTILAFFRSELELVPCAMLFRRSTISLGYARFASDFFLGADAILWIDLVAATGHAGYVDRDLARYRVHANTTTKTPLSKWHIENRQLAEYAIERLRENGRGNSALYKQIRTAARQLNIRITASSIAAAWSTSKRSALRSAQMHAQEFANVYGVIILMKSMIAVMLPYSWRPKLVALSRSVRRNFKMSSGHS